ncbi:MAG: hypothetical protein HYY22_09105 [Thaumarchaeota archaeon]|nr:hypothetical protein [Nitrososphaerota archaeon]
MPIEELTRQIAWATTQLTLVVVGVTGVTWLVASLLRGVPLPFRSVKMASNDLLESAVKALFQASIWAAVSSLIAWIVTIINSAA